MMPNWFPWIFIGGLVFIALSFTAAKYKEKDYKRMNLLQDFISGSILIAFAGVLVPDMFPKMELPNAIPSSFGNVLSTNEFDLQVGPPRLAGR
jgi:hypothetical protein